jgi:polysaccharide pyruvyl transferase WcaK-like protein
MKKISILDTSVCTKNLGDQIIMDAVQQELREVFKSDFFFNMPTHDYLSEESYKLLDQSDYVFVGGTNLLSSNMDKYNQWKITKKDKKLLSNVILMGVGWWQYQDTPNKYTSKLLNSVLHNTLQQSTRDHYTTSKLSEIGMKNVLNTGCPTTWKLTPDHCSQIPQEKSESVIMTLTDYKPHKEKDDYLYQILCRRYKKVYLWLQGSGDYSYAKELYGNKVEYVDPSLKAFDDILSSNESLDYVGTRLHAGVRAMKHKRRSVIIAVDNRASEMGADIGFKFVERQQLSELKEIIDNDFRTEITLPVENIEAWRKQFQ